MSGQPSITRTYDDLEWLMRNGALAGVAEILRERRRQIEQLGWTPGHDRECHADGWLMDRAGYEADRARGGIGEGVYGPPECERAMARAGALAAAEIDRLASEFGPEPEPATYRCWHVPASRPGGTSTTHHVHGPDQPCPLHGSGS